VKEGSTVSGLLDVKVDAINWSGAPMDVKAEQSCGDSAFESLAGACRNNANFTCEFTTVECSGSFTGKVRIRATVTHSNFDDQPKEVIFVYNVEGGNQRAVKTEDDTICMK
jgi:hypothetical protein